MKLFISKIIRKTIFTIIHKTNILNSWFTWTQWMNSLEVINSLIAYRSEHFARGIQTPIEILGNLHTTNLRYYNKTSHTINVNVHVRLFRTIQNTYIYYMNEIRPIIYCIQTDAYCQCNYTCTNILHCVDLQSSISFNIYIYVQNIHK